MTFSCKWLPLCLVSDYFLTVWAVSIVNSSKLTHSLFISLCLSWISLPVFEALQWADDCLGRDYYTNLSTLSAKPSAQGACVCVCVCFQTSLHIIEKVMMRSVVCEYAFSVVVFIERSCVCDVPSRPAPHPALFHHSARTRAGETELKPKTKPGLWCDLH